VIQFEVVDFSEGDWVADQPSAERIVDSKRALQRFYDELQRLPPRQRMVIELRRIEGLRVRATAECLAMSVSSVEKLRANAMRRLSSAVAGL
jgi:RNA polymerase sigma factor (sigma-70 family)